MIAWPVARIEAEKRRLEVLRYLSVANGYELAGSILRDKCRLRGIPTNTDQMNACLAWLEEQDLVTLREIEDDTIARITGSGRETARGLRAHPGVMQPDP